MPSMQMELLVFRSLTWCDTKQSANLFTYILHKSTVKEIQFTEIENESK